MALMLAVGACTSGEDPDPAPSPSADAARTFRIDVPDGWKDADPDGSPQEGFWLGPELDDGTRLGLSVEAACLTQHFDDEVVRLQTADDNWQGYEVIDVVEAADVAGADRATQWLSTYELRTADDGEIVTILRVELLAALADGTAAHLVYEGRDAHVDQAQGEALVRSIRLVSQGCDGSVDVVA